MPAKRRASAKPISPTAQYTRDARQKLRDLATLSARARRVGDEDLLSLTTRAARGDAAALLELRPALAMIEAERTGVPITYDDVRSRIVASKRQLDAEIEQIVQHGEHGQSHKNSIPIEIFHTITETDSGPYHSWSMSGLGSARNDEKFIRGEAEKSVANLAKAGIPAHVKVTVMRTAYPKEW